MAKLTINEMILKTISTKLNKEPKYKEILEAMGYTIFDSGWSDYNNWSVKNKETNRLVVLSRGYDNKKRLYSGGSYIRTNDFKKVDYVGFLNCNREKYNPYISYSETEYSKLRKRIKQTKMFIHYKNENIEETQEKIKKLQDYLEQERKEKNEYLKDLAEIKRKIQELK